MIGAIRQRLVPQISTADLVREYLKQHKWDAEAAYQLYLKHVAVVREEREQAELEEGSLEDEEDEEDDSDPGSEEDSSGEQQGQGVDTASRSRTHTGSPERFDPPRPQSTLVVGDDTLLKSFRDANIPVESNAEQQRRTLAVSYAWEIKLRMDVVLTVSEAVLLLFLDDWDPAESLKNFSTREEARDRLRRAFDGMRGDTTDVVQHSARLATLNRITARADWYSMRLYLQKHGWDVVKAVVEWYTSGIRPYVKKDLPQRKRKSPGWGLRLGLNQCRLPMPSLESTVPAEDESVFKWTDETANYTNAPTPTQITPFVPGREWHEQQIAMKADPNYKHDKEKERQPGFFINTDKTAVQVGLFHQDNLIIEWFAKGRYWFLRFKHFKYYWPELPQVDHDTDASSSEIDVDESRNDDGNDDDGEGESLNDHERVDGDADDEGFFFPDTVESARAFSTPPPDAPPTGSKKIPFDGNDQGCIKKLNAWRNLHRVRIGREIIRAGAQLWIQEEIDLFYDMHQELLDDMTARFPLRTRRELVEVLSIDGATKQGWVDRINQRLSGRILTEGGKPRTDRQPGALITQRQRFPKIFVHFRVKPDSISEKKLDADDKQRLEAERDALEAADVERAKLYRETNPEENDKVEWATVQKSVGAKKRPRESKKKRKAEDVGEGSSSKK